MSSSATDRALPIPAELQELQAETLAGAPTPANVETDNALMLRVQAGDPDALGVLFDRYAPLVFGIGLRIVRDPGEAQELVQEVFLYLHRKSRLFNPAKSNARSWLIQVAYHRALDRRQRLDSQGFYSTTDLESFENTFSVGPEAEHQTELAQWGEALRCAFRSLSEKQRMTLELFFFEGYTLREISQRIGESPENTRHYYYRALEKLRRDAQMNLMRQKKGETRER